MTSVSCASFDDSAETRRAIRSVLQGPVAKILAEIVPDLQSIPRQAVFDYAVEDLSLLDECFQSFRRERDRFRHLLVDAKGAVILADDTVLSCGRTLQEVIAMVVRTAAKRYFRMCLDPAVRPKRPAAPRKPGLLARLLPKRLIGPAPAAKSRPLPASRADTLYAAIKSYLIYEWQVHLVPTYADLSADQVQRLGSRLLELRSRPDLMRALSGAPDPVPTASAPPPPPVAPCFDLGPFLTVDGKRLKAASFANTLTKPAIRAVLPKVDHVIHLGAVLGSVSGDTAKAMVTRLNVGADQIAVMMVLAHQAVGVDTFARVFARGGDAALIERFLAHAGQAGIGPASSPADCAAFIETLFSRVKGWTQA